MPPKKTTELTGKNNTKESKEPNESKNESTEKIDKNVGASSKRVFLIHFEKLKEETGNLTQEKKDSLKDSEFSGATPIVAAKLAFDLLFNEIVNEPIVCVFSLQEKIEGKKKLFHYRGERIKKETGEYINVVKSHAPSPSTRSEESKEIKEPTTKIIEEPKKTTKNIKKSDDEPNETTHQKEESPKAQTKTNGQKKNVKTTEPEVAKPKVTSREVKSESAKKIISTKTPKVSTHPEGARHEVLNVSKTKK